MALFNPFVMRKWTALILPQLLVVVLFFIGLTYYGFWVGLLVFFVALILGSIMGNLMLRNPFRTMLEGKGLLCVNLDSTGIFRFFNVGLQNPYVRGKFNKQPINDIFDRATVAQIAPPIQNKKPAEYTKEGNIKIELNQADFNDARFAMFHFPVLIWNDQIKTLLTKDFFSHREKDAFAEHSVLYLNKQVEDLNRYLLNFGRYIVENIKPKESFLQNKWAIIIIVIIVIIVGIIAIPVIIKFVTTLSEPASSALQKASSGALTPK